MESELRERVLSLESENSQLQGQLKASQFCESVNLLSSLPPPPHGFFSHSEELMFLAERREALRTEQVRSNQEQGRLQQRCDEAEQKLRQAENHRTDLRVQAGDLEKRLLEMEDRHRLKVQSLEDQCRKLTNEKKRLKQTLEDGGSGSGGRFNGSALSLQVSLSNFLLPWFLFALMMLMER